jgi:hypothetical protein
VGAGSASAAIGLRSHLWASLGRSSSVILMPVWTN